MKTIVSVSMITLMLASCRTLTSTTYIKANDGFILGNNEHGAFTVKLKNISKNELKLWKAPIGGGQHSPIVVASNESVNVKVAKNTALKINNDHNEEAAVELYVKGDTGLSMGYKN
ncbi:MAG: hypothetical protein R2822_31440 [Spirosomataceae bacterium]